MRPTSCVLAATLLLAPAVALADQPPSASRAGAPHRAAQAKNIPGARVADATLQQAPLYPKWEVPSITLSGLTVWTYRPGHFQGQ